jgi:hypothetical protein
MSNTEVVGDDKRKKRDRGSPTVCYTIQEFCDHHRLSRSQYYRLRARRLGPAESRVLDKIFITAESAAKWRRKNTVANRRAS